jgi:hypothetical protein
MVRIAMLKNNTRKMRLMFCQTASKSGLINEGSALIQKSAK